MLFERGREERCGKKKKKELKSAEGVGVVRLWRRKCLGFGAIAAKLKAEHRTTRATAKEPQRRSRPATHHLRYGYI